jgi:hypothetical protein
VNNLLDLTGGCLGWGGVLVELPMEGTNKGAMSGGALSREAGGERRCARENL